VTVLKQYFNETISNGGGISAYLTPQWEETVRLVNEARKGKDSRYAHRNLASIRAMAGRDFYAADVPSLGIAEWRDFGHALLELQCQNPSIGVHEIFLKRKAAKRRNSARIRNHPRQSYHA
jgi:hypothetical protein